jgi:peroxiredoxin
VAIAKGDRVPGVKLRTMGEAAPREITADEIFAGKKVALFGLPGAFTRTCSAKHLPGFVEQAEALKAKGVDTVACISVNDAFVMDAWGKAQNATGKVLMLADGNGDFARAAGIETDNTANGMGRRMRRFSAYVVDGTVEILNLENPGNYEVSDAGTLLKQIG